MSSTTYASISTESIIDTFDQSILILDNQLRVAAANLAYCERFFTTRSSTEGQTISSLNEGIWDIPGLQHRLYSVLSEHKSFRGFEIEVDQQEKGNRHMSLSAKVIQSGNAEPEHILLAIQNSPDTTRSESSELIAARQESRRVSAEMEAILGRFDATMKALPNGFIIYDTNANIQFINDTARSILGYDDERIRRAFAERMADLDITGANQEPLQESDNPVTRALRGEIVRGMVVRIHTGNRALWLSMSTAPIRVADEALSGAVMNFSDITELIVLQHSLSKSESRFRSMFELHRAVMLLIDPETGQIKDANEAAKDYYGYSRDQLRSMTIRQVNQLPPGQIQEKMKATTDAERAHHIFPHRLANGTVRWVEVYSSPILIKERPLLFSIIHDVTERKHAEKELQRRTEELSALNQELESFSYSVSHDLRSPLNTISGFATILQEDYKDQLDDEGKEYLRRIDAGVHKMARIIDDMLTLSRVSQHDMIRIDMNLSEKVRGILSELQEGSPGRRVNYSIQEEIHACADPNLINIALENLLRNAWKFTSKKECTSIRFGTIAVDGKTAFFVQDNGAGFPMSHAKRLFIPFQRLHSEKEFTGTGIGLPIVERVVRRHGGNIWGEGEEGKGATFYFTLDD